MEAPERRDARSLMEKQVKQAVMDRHTDGSTAEGAPESPKASVGMDKHFSFVFYYDKDAE